MVARAPKLSDLQRQQGAASSLAVRQTRAAIKQWLRVYGRLNRYYAIDHVLDLDAAQGMKVKTLLLAIPYVGPVRANAILEAAGLQPNASVRSVGVRQRRKLLESLSRSECV